MWSKTPPKTMPIYYNLRENLEPIFPYGVQIDNLNGDGSGVSRSLGRRVLDSARTKIFVTTPILSTKSTNFKQ